MYEVWADAMKVVACLAAVAFAVTYAVTVPWWRSAISRNVLWLMSAIGLFLVLSLVQMVNPGVFDSWPWLRPTTWTVLALLFVHRFVILLREHVLRRRDGHDDVSERTRDEDPRS